MLLRVTTVQVYDPDPIAIGFRRYRYSYGQAQQLAKCSIELLNDEECDASFHSAQAAQKMQVVMLLAPKKCL